ARGWSRRCTLKSIRSAARSSRRGRQETPMSTLTTAPFKGVFPGGPTTFTDLGELDLPSQKRCIDFMIDAGSNGLAILANFSEQFVLADDERELLTKTILDHVAGRVPVIVTTTHFSSKICAG